MILERYILRQVGGPILVSFCSLNLLFLLVQLIKMGEVMFSADLSFWDLVRTSLLALPSLCIFTLPLSVIAGVLLGMGRCAADNELLALGALGIRPLRLLTVPVLVGLGLSLVGLWLSHQGAPAAQRSLRNAFIDLARRHAAASLQAGQFFEEIDQVVLLPGQPGDTRGDWRGFLLQDQRNPESPYTLFAQRARVRGDKQRDALQLELSGGEAHQVGPDRPYQWVVFRDGRLLLDLGNLVSYRVRFLSEIDSLSSEQLDFSLQAVELTDDARRLRQAVWHRRWAFPGATLLFAVWGTMLPLGGRRRNWRGLLVLAVGLSTAYYLLMRGGDALVQARWLGPASAAWLPNGLMALVGLWRTLRVERGRP